MTIKGSIVKEGKFVDTFGQTTPQYTCPSVKGMDKEMKLVSDFESFSANCLFSASWLQKLFSPPRLYPYPAQ